ncbi:MAG: hypothetical protein FJ271_18125 [Planctomycetes bacterium]|nr:hypothetical protein [Planctomycetota bacterium]
MSPVARNLCLFALEQLLEGASKSIGIIGGEKAVAKLSQFLQQHFSDHSAKIEGALRMANERAWKSLELALEGDSFLSRCKAILVQAEQRAFAHQVQTFLEGLPLSEFRDQTADMRQECLRDLRAARKAGLLDMGHVRIADFPSQVSSLARYGDPQQRANEGLKLLAGIGAELKSRGFVHLAWLVNAQAIPGSSLLVTAVRFFFRRAVESDRELFQGLAWATWQQISEVQQRGFACLNAAIVQNAKRLEDLLAGTAMAGASSAKSGPLLPKLRKCSNLTMPRRISRPMPIQVTLRSMPQLCVASPIPPTPMTARYSKNLRFPVQWRHSPRWVGSPR